MSDQLMVTVFLKGGKAVQIPDDQLSQYLQDHADQLEPRKITPRRKPVATTASNR